MISFMSYQHEDVEKNKVTKSFFINQKSQLIFLCCDVFLLQVQKGKNSFVEDDL